MSATSVDTAVWTTWGGTRAIMGDPAVVSPCKRVRVIDTSRQVSSVVVGEIVGTFDDKVVALPSSTARWVHADDELLISGIMLEPGDEVNVASASGITTTIVGDIVSYDGVVVTARPRRKERPEEGVLYIRNDGIVVRWKRHGRGGYGQMFVPSTGRWATVRSAFEVPWRRLEADDVRQYADCGCRCPVCGQVTDDHDRCVTRVGRRPLAGR